MGPRQRDLWRYIWAALSEAGACDMWGSAEQARVTASWEAAGRPVGIAEWIIAEANTQPPPATELHRDDAS